MRQTVQGQLWTLSDGRLLGREAATERDLSVCLSESLGRSLRHWGSHPVCGCGKQAGIGFYGTYTDGKRTQGKRGFCGENFCVFGSAKQYVPGQSDHGKAAGQEVQCGV